MIYNEEAMSIGLIFRHAYDILNEKMQSGIMSKITGNSDTNDKTMLDAALFVPSIVNCAFACELFMKSILQKNIRGHKLNDLFSSLDGGIQEKIKNKTIKEMNSLSKTYSEIDFQNDLEKNSNIFAEWRYVYEGNSDSANYQFITNLMKATFDVACEE